MSIIVAAAWFLLSLGVGILAWRRGRNPVGWFLFALLMSPVIAGFVVVAFGDDLGKADHKELETGAYQTCSYCGHAHKKQAAMCPHCIRVFQQRELAR